jgi:hypothetical protein
MVAVVTIVTIATIVTNVLAQSLGVVRFTVSSQAAVDSVRRLGVDIVEVHARADRGADVVAVVGSPERLALAARGLVVNDVQRSPDAQAQDALRQLRGAAAYTVYRDYDDPARGIAAYLRSLPATHPNIASVDSIGATYEGRPILAVKIGPPGDDPNRPNVIYLATYHAREWASTEMALRLVVWLADSLPFKPGGSNLLQGRDTWIIPVANPDGYQYTFSTERLWRKNRQPNGDGTFGVDLNRNHNGFWGYDDLGSSRQPSSEVYRGPSVSSSPEVQVIEAFHRAHPPSVAVSYHTYTGTVLYPWSHANGVRTGDDAIFRALAGNDISPAIRDSIPGSVNTYYHPGPGWNLYVVNGDYTSYAYRAFRAAAFTVELTSGCCVNGAYYGFEFPDSEPLLERMFRDNLPFALGLLSAAGNTTQSTIPPGVPPASVQLESVWPDLRALIDVPAPPGGAAVDVATDSGEVSLIFAQRDTLGTGRRYVRMSTGSTIIDEQRATRLPIDGVGAEILARDGAEHAATGWTGFALESPGYRSDHAWHGYQDTLVSPPLQVQGRTALVLYFWTRHYGSLFAQQQRGRIEVSPNNGSTWTQVGQIVGAGPDWYPVALPLTGVATGSATLRVRFIAESLDWSIDDVALTAADPVITRLFGSRQNARAPSLDINANPVTSAPLVLRWAPAAGTTRVDVFSVTGTRVAGVTMSADPGRWDWDLTTSTGARVANGAYYLVLIQGDGTRIQRRVLVAR